MIRQRRQRRGPTATASRRRRANHVAESGSAHWGRSCVAGRRPSSRRLVWRRLRRARDGAARQLLGGRPPGDADRRTVPAAEARWRRQRPHPDRLGRDPAAQWYGSELHRRPTSSSRAPRRRASKCCPSSTARPPGRSRQASCARQQREGAEDPAGQDRRPAQPPGRTSSSWRSLATARAAASGPRTRACPQRPIRTWQIWNEENFKYFVARPNPADYGKLVKLSYAAIKSVDPGAKMILGGMFARPKEAEFKSEAAAGLLRHRLPRTDVQHDARDQDEVQRRRPAPYTYRLPAADPRHRRIARRPQGQPRCRARGFGSPRSAGAPSTRLGAATPSPKARRARRRS